MSEIAIVSRPAVASANGVVTLLMSAPALAKQPSGIASDCHSPALRSAPVIGTALPAIATVTGAVGATSTRYSKVRLSWALVSREMSSGWVGVRLQAYGPAPA